MGDDIAFWWGYLTNGKHLSWYASVHYTLIAALLGGTCALFFGLGGAGLRRSRFAPFRLIGASRMCCSSCSSRWPSNSWSN